MRVALRISLSDFMKMSDETKVWWRRRVTKALLDDPVLAECHHGFEVTWEFFEIVYEASPFSIECVVPTGRKKKQFPKNKFATLKASLKPRLEAVINDAREEGVLERTYNGVSFFNNPDGEYFPV